MQEKTLRKIFPALGTVNSLTLYDHCCPETAEGVRRRVLELHRRFSFFDPDSDVQRINTHAGIGPVRVHPDTMKLLSRALVYEELTSGAFSILCGASAQLWRSAIQNQQVPSADAVESCRDRSALGGLILNKEDGTAYLRCPGQQIDLGGIAKGYAADESACLLRKAGVRSAVINFGGTIVVLGKRRRIGVQNPFEPIGTSAASLSVRNKAVVTSGVYERGFTAGGRRLHHIIDLRTGCPAATGLASVTLVGKNATDLDALATAACVLGKSDIRPLLRRLRLRGIFIDNGGCIETAGRLPLQPAPMQLNEEERIYG